MDNVIHVRFGGTASLADSTMVAVKSAQLDPDKIVKVVRVDPSSVELSPERDLAFISVKSSDAQVGELLARLEEAYPDGEVFFLQSDEVSSGTSERTRRMVCWRQEDGCPSSNVAATINLNGHPFDRRIVKRALLSLLSPE